MRTRLWVMILAFQVCVSATGQSTVLDDIAAGLERIEVLREIILDPIEEHTLPNWKRMDGEAQLELLPIPPELEARQKQVYDPTLLTSGNRQYLSVPLPGSKSEKHKIVLLLQQPIRVNGIMKMLNFWFRGPETGVVSVYVIVADLYGIEYKLAVGRVNDPLWRKHACPVLPGLTQQHGYRPGELGATFLGFELDAQGEYHESVGIDRVTAVVDYLFTLEGPGSDSESMSDRW